MHSIRRARQALRTRHIAGIVVIAGQAGIAAALSWIIAKDFLGREGPVFAPLTSLATIAAALGHRARQVIELLVGVGVGISIADGLLLLVGSGAWKIALVVFAAVAVGLILVGRSGALVSQAGGTATLFATLTGSQGSLELPRIIDAGVGTSVGFLVFSLLLPLNPFRAVDRAAEPLFDSLTRLPARWIPARRPSALAAVTSRSRQCSALTLSTRRLVGSTRRSTPPRKS
jgi:uncharacterized membrane protein YgaE (UPF0421/DUF939 family)